MLFRQKTLLTLGLFVYFVLLYFTLQRVIFFVPQHFRLSRIDDLIAFDPRWTFVYQSLYLFLPLPWLATSREQLDRYARGFFMLTIVSFLFFFAFPIEGPRPNEMANSTLYRLLVSYDRNLNAFPSLHAALAVYTLLLAFRIMPRQRIVIAIFGTLWIALVLYATLATKQHYFIDVIAGAVLAIAADFLAWRKHDSSRSAHRTLHVPSDRAAGSRSE